MERNEAEDLAFDLLREVVNRARNGLSYRVQLVKLREALEKAPEVREGIESALNRTRRASLR